MKEILKNKLVLSVVTLAIVGVLGAFYTMAHSGPITANAQTAITKNNIQADQDKETKDDAESPEPSHAVQQKSDANEIDESGANNTTKEIEDGN
jgi:type IV secretory pathway VirB10-like protein